MKLAFSGEGRYPDFDNAYRIFTNRLRGHVAVDKKTYSRIVKMYCESLAERLYEQGMIDLPGDMGTITTAILTRRPQYRGNKFIGFGKKEANGTYDGTLKAFGLVFLPRHDKKNLRCYGYVCNRRLFQRIKEKYKSDECSWVPLKFNDTMI